MTSNRNIAPETLAMPSSVVLEQGEGGLPRLQVAGRGGSAEIYLQGAHVTSWRPAGQEGVIWLSRASKFSPGMPIRGGIPICFPWFGPHRSDASAPLHGLARLHDWALVAADEVGDDVSLTFRLNDLTQTGFYPWPFPFEATYRVVIGTTLQLSLEIMNKGTGPATFEEALHTYFAVRDIRSVAVRGLASASYVDRTIGAEPVQRTADPVRIEKETDRMYLDSAGTVTIEDTAGERVIRIRKSGSASTVVWNPGIDKSKSMADFGNDEWVETICVEPCNAGPTAVLLEPRERHLMITTLDVQPLHP